MSEALVIIPTYNEIENIGKIIDAVMRLSDGFDVLVIDDASPDGTQDTVLSKIEQYPGRVYMETRQGKLGLGTAYIHGFKWALSRQYGYVIEMDADFSHNPDDLPRLYQHSYRIEIRIGRKCRELADEARTDVILCIDVCKGYHPHASPRLNRRIRMLSR